MSATVTDCARLTVILACLSVFCCCCFFLTFLLSFSTNKVEYILGASQESGRAVTDDVTCPDDVIAVPSRLAGVSRTRAHKLTKHISVQGRPPHRNMDTACVLKKKQEKTKVGGIKLKLLKHNIRIGLLLILSKLSSLATLAWLHSILQLEIPTCNVTVYTNPSFLFLYLWFCYPNSQNAL